MSEAGKRIVVTGVSRGLGLAMTAGFIERGHTVYGCARSSAAIAELQARFGEPHRFEVVDVGRLESVQAWSSSVLAAAGGVDLLINNAALINQPAPLWETPADAFTQLIDVNVNGVFRVLHSFLPSMVAATHGVIVNVSSGWGRSTAGDFAPYCASKWAIEGLTRALAQELPLGMAAVSLDPGVIDTQMLRRTFLGNSHGAYPKPEEWSQRAVPFLLGITAKDNGEPLRVPR